MADNSLHHPPRTTLETKLRVGERGEYCAEVEGSNPSVSTQTFASDGIQPHSNCPRTPNQYKNPRYHACKADNRGFSCGPASDQLKRRHRILIWISHPVQ